MQNQQFAKSQFTKWGETKLEKLPKEFDLKRLKQAKPILAEEPILPTILSPDLNIFNQIQSLHNGSKISQNEETKSSQQISKIKRYKFRPSIDSYIISTIKLNQVLRDKTPFEEVDFFRKSKRKNAKKLKINRGNYPKITTDEDARFHLKQFISIMAIHCGFNKISSFALDTLVDVLDHFLESFFKLFKNLSIIKPIDLIKKENENFSNHYSSEHFIEQALVESGFGTIHEIKEFYINDIILYYKETFKKVSKLYDDYKIRKNAERLKDAKNESLADVHGKSEHDIHLDEFIKESNFLNDESNSMLGELLTDAPHLDEELNKLLQMIGQDPFSLINEDFQHDNETKDN